MSKIYLINTDKLKVQGVFADVASAEAVAGRMRQNNYLGDIDDVTNAFKVTELHQIIENTTGYEEAKQRSKAAYGDRLVAVCDDIDWSKSAPKATGGGGGKRNGSCAKVWEIADKMKGKPRKEVIAACENAGINKGTASTQYQKWKNQASA